MKPVVHSVAAAVAVLLSIGAALATPTPQQQCDSARITAWKKYVSCVDVRTKVALPFDWVASAKCRHNYFHNWATFQTAARYLGSTCVGPRFVDNGDGTVTDRLTTLVWEQKDSQDSVPNFADPHDADNGYPWSTGTDKPDGTAFTSFLAGAGTGLNTAGFAGATGWRLPTLVELQTIVRDFPCSGVPGGAHCFCYPRPCIDGTFGPTQTFMYWSATGYLPFAWAAWCVNFFDGSVGGCATDTSYYVRAVRGGL